MSRRAIDSKLGQPMALGDKRRDQFKAIILIWVPGMKYLSTVASLRRNRRVKQFTVVCFEKCAACH